MLRAVSGGGGGGSAAQTGAGAPSTTPASEGLMYVDTTNNIVYLSTGTASSADWMPLNINSVPLFLTSATGLASVDTDIDRLVVPRAGILMDVIGYSHIDPTTSALTMDLNQNGATILSTKLTIDANENSSTTAATPYVFTGSVDFIPFSAGDIFSADMDAIDSGATAAGVSMTLVVAYA